MELTKFVAQLLSTIFVSLITIYMASSNGGSPCRMKDKLFNYNNCTTYYYCSVDMEGTRTWTITPCPEGTIFPADGDKCVVGDPSECYHNNFTCPDQYPSSTDESEEDLTRSQGPNEFVLVGTVGNKTYYAINTREKSWKDGKAYCEEYDYHIAKIENQEQVNVLQEELGKTLEEEKYYWVGARDSRSLKEFVWDDDEKQVAQFIRYYNEVKDHQSCLVYNNGTLRSGLCWWPFYTLCEESS